MQNFDILSDQSTKITEGDSLRNKYLSLAWHYVTLWRTLFPMEVNIFFEFYILR